MAQHSFIKSVGGVLIPATPSDNEFLNKISLGDVLSGEFKRVRNPVFHRKFFSLLNLGFTYWTPAGGAISPAEAAFVRGYIRHLSIYAGDYTATLESIADEYIAMQADKRADGQSLVKSFEAFRAWATIEAGYYDEFIQPSGLTIKLPKSISFAKMDDFEFHELYKSVLNTLWNFILNKSFPSIEAANNAAYQLLEYAA